MIDKYKNATFDGSTFPDDPYRIIQVKLGAVLRAEYLPVMEQALSAYPAGMRLLCTIMADTEGFRPGTRSYDNNNPGNIGNNDSGKNRKFPTLAAGILAQAHHIEKIIQGKSKYYPMGKSVYLRPYYSEEIAANLRAYNAKSGYVPGYRFVFTGQLDQFVKIYATLPRVNNVYLNRIVSYFKQNGIVITQESRLQEIVKMTGGEKSQAPAAGTMKYIKTQNGNGANLRGGPGTRWQIITGLPDGTSCQVIREDAGWSYVSIDGGTGWVKSEFLV